MKKYLIVTSIMIFLVAFVVWQSTYNTTPQKAVKIIDTLKEVRCGDGTPRDDYFLESKLESIRKLGDLEAKCGTKITDIAYLSTYLPYSSDGAKLQAQKLTESINELSDYSIKPLIFVEVSPAWKTQDLYNLSKGNYSSYFGEVLTALQANGVGADRIYGWILIPRPNLPSWDKKFITPEDFNMDYSNLVAVLRKYYPDSKTGVLFSSSTYEESPVNWGERDYRSLTNYIKDIDPKDIQIVGIEGYPWMAPLNGDGKTTMEPSEYLPKFLVEELLPLTNATDVIISTGTFAGIYTEDTTKKIIVPADVRKDQLDKTIEVLKRYNSNTLKVSVLLSNANSNYFDHADWTYFGTSLTENSMHQKVLLDFLKELYQIKATAIFNL